MTRYSKMQRWMLQVLAVMMLTSLLLTVTVFIAPTPTSAVSEHSRTLISIQVQAECPPWPFCGYGYGSCGSCGADKKTRWWCYCTGGAFCCRWVDCVDC